VARGGLQHLELLLEAVGLGVGEARQVAAGTRERLCHALAHGIRTARHHDDGDRCGRVARRRKRRGADDQDHVHVAAHEVPRKRRQPVLALLRVREVDRYVAAFVVARVAQAAEQGFVERAVRVALAQRQDADAQRPSPTGRLRERRAGHRAHGADDQSAPPHRGPGLRC
jgi:hypothetical protein